MFIRRKKNKSGSITVQIVDKSQGYRIIRTVGTARDQDKAEYLAQKARHIIRTCDGKPVELFAYQTGEESAVRRFLGQLANKQILAQAKGLKDQESFAIEKADGTRLIVTYSHQRWKKDAYARDRGLANLRKKIKLGLLTTEHINNQGYNKFLTLTGSMAVSIDEKRSRPTVMGRAQGLHNQYGIALGQNC